LKRVTLEDELVKTARGIGISFGDAPPPREG
jgi:hypothetical protein